MYNLKGEVQLGKAGQITKKMVDYRLRDVCEKPAIWMKNHRDVTVTFFAVLPSQTYIFEKPTQSHIRGKHDIGNTSICVNCRLLV